MLEFVLKFNSFETSYLITKTLNKKKSEKPFPEMNDLEFINYFMVHQLDSV